MKTIAKRIMAALITGTFLLSGCEKESLVPVSQENKGIEKSGDGNSMQGNFLELKWRLIHFTDQNGDHADRYKTYLFVFHAGGILEVTDGIRDFHGKWTDGLSAKYAGFKIMFEQGSPFSELNGQWMLDKQDHTLILKANTSFTKDSFRTVVFDEFMNI